MSASNMRRSLGLRDIAEAQGYRTKKTKSGVVVFAKDGKRTVGWHHTPSDCRAWKNVEARLKQIGVNV